MKCLFCKGKMERGHAPFHIDRKHAHLSLDRVPAWVCTQCGEVYFKESEVNAVQDLLKAVDEQTGKMARSA